MPSAARKDDTTQCMHIGGKLENAMPVCFEIDGRPVIRLADWSLCLSPRDVVVEGSATFTVCGLPVARVHDATIHAGMIMTGSADCEVGGPAFALPTTLSFANGTAEQISEAMRTFYLFSTTRSGQEMFRRLEAAARPVRINFYSGNNGASTPDNPSADTTPGIQTGSTIDWNPGFQVITSDMAGNPIAIQPEVALFHEMVHSLALAEGNDLLYAGTHEEQAIGLGAHSGDLPTENSLRDDLGLPRRGTHNGQVGTLPGTTALRPGEC